MTDDNTEGQSQVRVRYLGRIKLQQRAVYRSKPAGQQETGREQRRLQRLCQDYITGLEQYRLDALCRDYLEE